MITLFPVLTIAFPIAPIQLSFSSKVFASNKNTVSSVITFYYIKILNIKNLTKLNPAFPSSVFTVLIFLTSISSVGFL